ncbi:hypothetical protein CCUS01_13040 [Colletotrichum cuscutae]|uniref:GST N-terminal domain-containing protein n=1 Tax=Colletotrichum cuscutae TaxID=1209917 RepID=A0AAJ0DPM8_9PEZI|nr:hypothetical protein CCUS01_13040 [Colletotrichum cuscutae]
MDASNKPTITFYDIILDPNAYPMAPNPWKTRFALNFAKVPYRTTWVPLNAVAETRSSLQLPANRKHDDGTDFPTLPIIRDPLASSSSSGEKKEILVGDSFDIALHLQRTFLADKKHQLFQDGGNGSSTVSLHRVFNTFVDQVFSQYGAPLGGFYMPLDPRTAEADRQSFLDRFPGKKWEDLEIPPGSEVRKKMLADFETNLEAKLGPCFPAGGAGPFMDGRESPVYADFIVGGCMEFLIVGAGLARKVSALPQQPIRTPGSNAASRAAIKPNPPLGATAVVPVIQIAPAARLGPVTPPRAGDVETPAGARHTEREAVARAPAAVSLV